MWQVIVDECVVGTWNIEERAREEAARLGGYYALVCNILEAWGPWQKLMAPDGRVLRVVGPEVDYKAGDYKAWWQRVNVPVHP